MKKTLLLVGFVGLCLASPYLQVSAKKNIGNVNSDVIKLAARLALGASEDDVRGCKNAIVAYILQAKHEGRIIGDKPGDVYNLHLAIKRADGESVCCHSSMNYYDTGSITATYCNCNS
ncbi:hypothetical protein CHS0354_016332 [Potamilus streckersoni]|uniref:Uncharacterized protein n=1 Tax=Potamilus streckersoni TaxID=2493646 RepID=A0AAE0SAX2_9BIVA|nr:hypothetical protein CHS0354_016332 [Potamilus streckersoni]